MKRRREERGAWWQKEGSRLKEERIREEGMTFVRYRVQYNLLTTEYIPKQRHKYGISHVFS